MGKLPEAQDGRIMEGTQVKLEAVEGSEEERYMARCSLFLL